MGLKAGFPGAALRRAMIARHWTIEDLAREAGINRDTVSRALAGRRLTMRSEGAILATIGRRPVDPDVKAGLEELGL